MTEPARLHPDTLLRKSQLCELANISPNFLTKVIHREHNPLPVRRFPGSTMIRSELIPLEAVRPTKRAS